MSYKNIEIWQEARERLGKKLNFNKAIEKE